MNLPENIVLLSPIFSVGVILFIWIFHVDGVTLTPEDINPHDNDINEPLPTLHPPLSYVKKPFFVLLMWSC